MIFTDCRSCLEFECVVWVVGAYMRNTVKLWKISQIHIDVNEREREKKNNHNKPPPPPPHLPELTEVSFYNLANTCMTI